MTRAAVFFCELTGAYLYKAHGSCTCGQAVPDFDYGRMVGEVALPDVWPGAPCSACGAMPKVESLVGRAIFRRAGTGEELLDNDGKLPVGAVYESDIGRPMPDGRNLVCVTPGGHWHIDSRASNCTMPEDAAHRCWVRHGRPEDGTLHVDKIGFTCAAGAGSIQIGGWHGFLHDGIVSEAG